MSIVAAVSHVTKRYGHKVVLDDVSFQVHKGSIMGILGPNGSGKTTLLSILLGRISADAGSRQLCGIDPTPNILKRVGAALEKPNFYPYLSARRNLEIFAHIKNAPDEEVTAKLELTGLLKRQHDKFQTFSFGMKQRLSLAAALLNGPELLVLDEPTNGLDPQGIYDFRRIISDFAANGGSAIITSHALDEVEKVYTDLTVLRSGKLLFSGHKDMVQSELVILELIADNTQQLVNCLEAWGIKILLQEGEKVVIELPSDLSIKDLSNRIFGSQIVLTHLTQRKKALEDYFLELTKLS